MRSKWGKRPSLRGFSVFSTCKVQCFFPLFFEERAGLGGALFLKNTKWLQLFAQEILALASSGTEVNKTQSTD